MRTFNIRFAALLCVAAATAMLSAPVAAQQLSIAGQWDVGAGQANYTLEFGWPEQHAKLMGAPSTGRSVVIGDELPYLPAALAQRQENYRTRMTADTDARCLLPGVPRVMYEPYPFQIFQTPGVVKMAFEYVHATRNIYMNTPHPKGPIE